MWVRNYTPIEDTLLDIQQKLLFPGPPPDVDTSGYRTLFIKYAPLLPTAICEIGFFRYSLSPSLDGTPALRSMFLYIAYSPVSIVLISVALVQFFKTFQLSYTHSRAQELLSRPIWIAEVSQLLTTTAFIICRLVSLSFSCLSFRASPIKIGLRRFYL